MTEKFSKKGLTGRPTYYVTVDANEDDSSNSIQYKVFSWQFKRLEVGDTIKGHYVHGEHFFTTLDIVIDSVIVIYFLLILLFVWIILLCWLILKFIERREKRNKPSQFHKTKKIKKDGDKNKKGKKPILKTKVSNKLHRFFPKLSIWNVFLLSLFVGALLFTSGFAVNGVQKFSPIGKTTAEALVVDSDAVGSIYYYIGKYAAPCYTLDLLFTDEGGEEFRVIKEVTSSVYDKQYIGDTITISYTTRNPYNVFVRDFSLLNILESINYNMFILKILVLLSLLIFIIVRFYFWNKKRRK